MSELPSSKRRLADEENMIASIGVAKRAFDSLQEICDADYASLTTPTSVRTGKRVMNGGTDYDYLDDEQLLAGF